MIVTDPPFDMPGAQLASILGMYESNHLLLITTMRQLLEFVAIDKGWRLSFDFVLDARTPKKAMNRRVPHYTHQTGVYMMRGDARSVFNRERRPRSDQYLDNGFWPTILRAPRECMQTHGMAKNLGAMTDLIGSFEVGSIVDPFAGRCTVALASAEIGISATCIEMSRRHIEGAAQALRFVGHRDVEVRV